MLSRNQETEAWASIIAIKIIVLFAMIVIFCSCNATQPKGVVVRDVRYHLTFNRAVMHGDTLVNIERWSSVQQGVEVDSILNEETINAYVLFHNMHLEHNQ